MVLRSTILTSAKNSVLDEFDVVSHVGFSDDTSDELSSSDTLTGEFDRKVLDSSTKDTGTFVYEFEGSLGLTEDNGDTLNKIGFFTDIAGNTLKLSKLLPTGISKTADREISVGYELTVSATDST